MGRAPIDTLRLAPLFADLDEEELQLLADSMHERSFDAGEVATVEGEPGDGFYVVESGEAEISVQGRPEGRIGPGGYFGEIALLTGAGRAATITATSELRCYSIAPLDFRTIVEGNPAIAMKLMQSMVDTLS